MEHRSEPERTILTCECEEQIILLGPKDEWSSRRAVFRCNCGRELTLDYPATKEALAMSS
jgi:hypothetical protein